MDLTILRPKLAAALLAAALAACGTSGAVDDGPLAGAPVEDEREGAAGSLTSTLPVGTELEALYGTYLRRGPASSYSPLAIVPAGGHVTTVERTTPYNRYYKVSFNGLVGWAYGPYYRLATPAAAADAGAPAVDAGSPAPAPTPAPSGVVVDLRVDANRDGVVSVTDSSDELGEDGFSAAAGAIFLANIDDDTRRCPSTDSYGRPVPDNDLPKCNDASDEVVNGADDLLDLARLKTVPWSGAPNDAVGRLTVTPSAAASRVRLFKSNAGNFSVFKPGTATLTANDLRGGVELAIEATDIVRDAAVWDGSVTVTLRVTGSGLDASDAVKLRVAPVLTFHHLSDVQTLYATSIPGDSASSAFRATLSSNLSSAGVANPLDGLSAYDQWAQDFFEPGYMAMPAPGGQKVIRVNFRSANVQGSGSFPLREAGRLVFTDLRGKDVAGIQQYDASYDTDGSMDSLNSFGNLETIPPYSFNGQSYPLGRIIRGSTSTFMSDPSFDRMLKSQNAQPMVNIDTSWLLVGHVDETISFIRANTPRGWVALVNDARLAKTMLQNAQAQGFGATRLFVGKQWLDDYNRAYSAEISISALLQDTDVMSESAKAAAEVDGQLQTLKAATGLTDAEIIRVPYLHYPVSGLSLGYQPGTVNGVVVNGGHFFAPDPHGPVIGGKDLFKDQLQKAMAPYGVTVHWIEDWDLYHRLAGEVHCGTNAHRAIPSTRWWESGR